MNKKRRMSQDKFAGWVELTPAELANLYKPKSYGSVSYTVNVTPQRQAVDKLLNELHTMQLDMIDQAVEVSDYKEAKEIIDYIRRK